MQFYPDASLPEERAHPGLYRRRNGQVDLASVRVPALAIVGRRSFASFPNQR